MSADRALAEEVVAAAEEDVAAEEEDAAVEEVDEAGGVEARVVVSGAAAQAVVSRPSVPAPLLSFRGTRLPLIRTGLARYIPSIYNY
jgi:hypothetical protein